MLDKVASMDKQMENYVQHPFASAVVVVERKQQCSLAIVKFDLLSLPHNDFLIKPLGLVPQNIDRKEHAGTVSLVSTRRRYPTSRRRGSCELGAGAAH